MSAKNAEKILVIGTGTMGEGIAQTFAQNGFDVRFVARREEPLTRALGQIRQNVRQFIEFDLIHETAEQVTARIEGVVTTDMAQAVEGCSYVVETVREVLDDKRALIAAIQAVNPNVVIGSNTGSMTVDSLAEGMPNPATIIGIHYFNPAHIIPLVEVHRGSQTSDAAFELTERMMKESGKNTALVRKEMPGFIVNRVMGAITRECAFILDEGICTPEDLNTAIKSSTGFRFACLGPMEVDDMIGLDICATVSGRVFPRLSNATGPSKLILERVERGELGIKTGKGWLDYGGRTRAEILEEKNRALLPQLKLFLEAEGRS
jgi:3-hydroxybutyryl-CoA dehydrogenase